MRHNICCCHTSAPISPMNTKASQSREHKLLMLSSIPCKTFFVSLWSSNRGRCHSNHRGNSQPGGGEGDCGRGEGGAAHWPWFLVMLGVLTGLFIPIWDFASSRPDSEPTHSTRPHWHLFLFWIEAFSEISATVYVSICPDPLLALQLIFEVWPSATQIIDWWVF